MSSDKHWDPLSLLNPKNKELIMEEYWKRPMNC